MSRKMHFNTIECHFTMPQRVLGFYSLTSTNTPFSVVWMGYFSYRGLKSGLFLFQQQFNKPGKPQNLFLYSLHPDKHLAFLHHRNQWFTHPIVKPLPRHVWVRLEDSLEIGGRAVDALPRPRQAVGPDARPLREHSRIVPLQDPYQVVQPFTLVHINQVLSPRSPGRSG